MKQALVCYHAKCYDGLLAAYAAWVCRGDSDTDYLPMNYGDTVPESLAGRTVFMLDFSVPYETLCHMAREARNIIIIDHHKTAQEDLVGRDLPNNVELLFDMHKAGCVLAAEYFLGSVPWFFDYIGDRDIWAFKFPETKDFCAGFSAEFPLPSTGFADLQHQLVNVGRSEMSVREEYARDRICGKGRTLRDYRDRLMESWLEDLSITFVQTPEFAIHRVGVLTGIPREFVSEMAQLALTQNPDLSCVVIAAFKPDSPFPKVQCSWRSEDSRYDVSVIAKALGGGGHRNAAGCTINLDAAVAYNIL